MMSFIKDAKISRKLPIIIVGLTLVSVSMTAFSAYYSAYKTNLREVEVRLQAVLVEKSHRLEQFFEAIKKDIDAQRLNLTVIQAIQDFSMAWDQIPGEPTQYLQKAYIHNNPNPTGQKENLDAAPDGSLYSQYHAKYHEFFRQLQRTHEYYDVFLFDKEGNLIYSVFKELDYATNLVTGKWSGSDLGAAFRAARANAASSKINFFDFAPYGPSYDAPASFISVAVNDASGNFIGVLAYQMPVSELNAVMQDANGLGEEGHAFLVGEDFLMRNDTRLTEEDDILKTTFKNNNVSQALSGQSSINKNSNHDGETWLSVYEPFEFLGVKWAMIAESQHDEILMPIYAMRNNLLLPGFWIRGIF